MTSPFGQAFMRKPPLCHASRFLAKLSAIYQAKLTAQLLSLGGKSGSDFDQFLPFRRILNLPAQGGDLFSQNIGGGKIASGAGSAALLQQGHYFGGGRCFVFCGLNRLKHHLTDFWRDTTSQGLRSPVLLNLTG